MRKTVGLLGIAVMTLAAIWGCATTNMETFKDSKAGGKTYKTIMISGQFSDLMAAKSAENTFCEVLREQGITCVTSLDLMPPTRKYDDQEKANILKDNGIEAVLLISLKDAYEEQKHIPGQSKTNCRTDYFGNIHCDTQQSPGYNASAPRMKCEFTLMDVETNGNVWMASSFTAAHGIASSYGQIVGDFDDMMRSLAKEALTKLSDDGLIMLAPKPQK